MKKITFILLLISSLVNAQNWEGYYTYHESDSTLRVGAQHFPYTPNYQLKDIIYIKDTVYVRIGAERLFIKSIHPSYFVGRPNSILHTNTIGQMLASDVDSLYINYNRIVNPPEIKRTETHVGATNGSGDYTVTFSTSYTGVPFIAASIYNQSVNQFVRVTNVTQTGFTVNAYGFDTIGSALQIDTTPIGSLTIYVFVSE
jgi:hypothetical protein